MILVSFCYSDEISVQVNNSNQPIYEYPPPKYSAERILEILLDPCTPINKVCKEKPTGVTCSTTYVVNTRNLKRLDDIKKDEFGIWNCSGSHPTSFRVKFKHDRMVAEKCEKGAVGGNIYYLRRLHCTHPSDVSFKRMICFVSGKY